jgi:hypothetical protein
MSSFFVSMAAILVMGVAGFAYVWVETSRHRRSREKTRVD